MGVEVAGRWNYCGDASANVVTLDNRRVADSDADVALYHLEEERFEVIVQSPFFDSMGKFSPDGQWIAYVTSESGSFEVYVQTLGGPGGSRPSEPLPP